MKRLLFCAIASLVGTGCATTPAKPSVVVASPRPTRTTAPHKADATPADASPADDTSPEVTIENDPDNAPPPELPPTSDPHEARRRALEEAKAFGLSGVVGVGNDQDLTSILSGVSGSGVANLGASGGVLGGPSVGSASGLRLGAVAAPTHGKPLPPPPPPKAPGPPTRMAIVSLNAKGISAESVSDAFDRSDRALRDCYEAELERNPVAEATLTLEIAVTKDGRTTDPRRVTSDPDNPSLVKCVQKAALDMTFARPVSDATVTAKLTLRRPPNAHLE